jgi:hypothetical protein
MKASTMKLVFLPLVFFLFFLSIAVILMAKTASSFVVKVYTGRDRCSFHRERGQATLKACGLDLSTQAKECTNGNETGGHRSTMNWRTDNKIVKVMKQAGLSTDDNCLDSCCGAAYSALQWQVKRCHFPGHKGD